VRESRLVVAAGAFAVLLTAASRLAAAPPSLWERARYPGARSEERLLVGIERMLDEEELAGPDAETAERLARAAVAMIDLAKVREPRSARLAFVMARALVDADVGRSAEAETLLETAVARLPVGPLLADAWHELGVVRALKGDHVGARDAQSRVLELAWDPDERAIAFYYRAASEVRLRELPAAESDYRAAAEHAREPETQALARFGFGVVLEREGDLPSAYAAFEQGLAIRLPLSTYVSDDPLELPGIFFTPAYERFYLAALLAMTRARQADSPVAERVAYEQSITDWDAYLLAAAPDEPWVPNARRHRERSVSELRRLPRAHPTHGGR
jgi:tetratricopeptide (TPR) repeat protein